MRFGISLVLFVSLLCIIYGYNADKNASVSEVTRNVLSCDGITDCLDKYSAQFSDSMEKYSAQFKDSMDKYNAQFNDLMNTYSAQFSDLVDFKPPKWSPPFGITVGLYFGIMWVMKN